MRFGSSFVDCVSDAACDELASSVAAAIDISSRHVSALLADSESVWLSACVAVDELESCLLWLNSRFTMSCFTFFRRDFSLRSHRWQKVHSAPRWQPLSVCRNAQGLQRAELCSRLPMDGRFVPGLCPSLEDAAIEPEFEICPETALQVELAQLVGDIKSKVEDASPTGVSPPAASRCSDSPSLSMSSMSAQEIASRSFSLTAILATGLEQTQ